MIETLAAAIWHRMHADRWSKIENWEKAIRSNTKVLFLESPTNPTLEVIDICRRRQARQFQIGAKLVVDNVFATPLFQKPLELGAHIVVYSTTKHIDGQGRCLGGMILSDKEWVDENLHDYFRHTGPAMSPFNAWTLLKGLETLAVARQPADGRTPRRSPTSLPITAAVAKVIYPGRKDHPQADIIARQMTGGSTLRRVRAERRQEGCVRLSNALEIILISNNLGDAKSLITHPATTTHKNLTDEARAELGISRGLLRLSAGHRRCGRSDRRS